MMESSREKALELCCENYESAIKIVQAEKLALEKQLKQESRKLERLINLVKNNAKNSETILRQL